ncbi:hypothetical protein ANCCAN_20608 [Ancylostoma caninum]|uniref:Laminin EGF-like domain-containing protein n=1 Tax=Ancylostoma caninum TaxID=29170 RepID=A0A368FRB1_ANCCA|nr:hypothetical protein ANCCAN_20608 [Ancylostoma caninum]
MRMKRSCRRRRIDIGIYEEPHIAVDNQCVHGRPVDGECECEQEYIGRHCEKKKHCASFRRYRNGS